LEEKREVTYEEGERFMDEYNLDYFCESSAKSGDNIHKMFLEAAKILYKEYKNTDGHNNTFKSYISGASKGSIKLKPVMKDVKELKEFNTTQSGDIFNTKISSLKCPC
jgi:hypothetical protein